MSFSMFLDFSEEKMAAFIDGLLSPEEMASFQKEMNDNPIMQEVLDEVKSDVFDSSASAVEDYPGLLAEETIGSMFPLIQNSLDCGLSASDLFSVIPLPPPVFEEDIDSYDDSDNILYDNNNNDCLIDGNDESLSGEEESGDINLDQ